MSEFLRPRLNGPRFEDGKIPLEMLSDLSALREMVIEVAKWRYLNANPERKRSPKGFTNGVSLALAGVDKGSAIPVIDVEFEHPQVVGTRRMPGIPGRFDQYFVEARDAIIDTIAAAELDNLTSEHLPPNCLEYFDRIGRRLRDEESIEFSSPTRATPARLTRQSRRKLVLASRMREMTEEVRVRGSIPEVDQDRMSFELQLLGGRKISGVMYEQHFEVIMEVFNGYKEDQKALIWGIGKYDRQNRLVGLESIEDIAVLDPLDVPSRLSELKKLRSGWMDGEGVALDPDGLEWLSGRFDRFYPDELPLPHVYPTVEGSVQAEWSLSSQEVSLSVELATRVGEWHVLEVDTSAEESEEINLADDNDWMRLTQFIRSLSEASL